MARSSPIPPRRSPFIPSVPTADPGSAAFRKNPWTHYAAPISIILPALYFLFSFAMFLGSRPQPTATGAPAVDREVIRHMVRDTCVALGAGLIPTGLAAAMIGLVAGVRQRRWGATLLASCGLVMSGVASLAWIAAIFLATREAPRSPQNTAIAPQPREPDRPPWAPQAPWDGPPGAPQWPANPPQVPAGFGQWPPNLPFPHDMAPPAGAPGRFTPPPAAPAAPSATDFPPGPVSPESQAAVKELQGQWQKASIEMDGRTVNVEGQQIRCTFQGNRITDAGLFSPLVVTEFRVDPRRQPKHLDRRFTGGAVGPWISRGIYQLDGQTLTICSGGLNTPRPTDFSTGPGDGRSKSVYRRLQ